MRIVYKGFIITKSLGINKFDVAKIYRIKTGKMEGSEVEKNLAYGVNFHRIFTIMLEHLVEEEKAEAEVTFKEYLEAYNKVGEELKQEIQRIGVSLSKS